MRGNREILAGRYEIMDTVGSGGEGAVYLARDLSTGEKTAIKELFLRPEEQKELSQRTALLKQLHHRGLPRLLMTFREKGVVYLVMEYIEGRSLRDMLSEEAFADEKTVVDILLQLCDILRYLHTQHPKVYYLDLKPSNILLDAAGQIHLIDFGAARLGDGGLPLEGAVSLTRGYAAPEQYLSGCAVDERTDLYALGVTAHYLLTGKNPNQPPFVFEQVRKLNPKITNKTAEVVERLLQPEPEDRFQSAGEVAAALRESGSGRGRGLLVSKNKLLLAAAGAFAVMLAVLLHLQPSAAAEEIETEEKEETAVGERGFSLPIAVSKSPNLRLSLESGSYDSYQLLQVDYDPSLGKLYYTIDGSDPAQQGIRYEDGIVIARPKMSVRVKLMGFDGGEWEQSADYEVTVPVEEIEIPTEEPIGWDIYYALGKAWTEPLYSYELAEIRKIPEEDITKEDVWLIEKMPFLLQQSQSQEY